MLHLQTTDITSLGIFLVDRFHSITPLTLKELEEGIQSSLAAIPTTENITLTDSALYLAEFLVDEDFLSFSSFYPGALSIENYISFKVEEYFDNVFRYLLTIPGFYSPNVTDIEMFTALVTHFCIFFYNRVENPLQN